MGGIRYGIVCPSLKLQVPWIKKLEDRYLVTKLDKDYKALKNAEDRYEDNIKELMDSGFRVIELGDMDYDLSSIVSGLENAIDCGLDNWLPMCITV